MSVRRPVVTRRPRAPDPATLAQLPIGIPEPEQLSEREAFEYMHLAKTMTYDQAIQNPAYAPGVRNFTETFNRRRREVQR